MEENKSHLNKVKLTIIYKHKIYHVPDVPEHIAFNYKTIIRTEKDMQQTEIFSRNIYAVSPWIKCDNWYIL